MVEAVREHRVATLLLGHDAAEVGRPVRAGPSAYDIAVGRTEARNRGIGRPTEARADDALLRACVAADSEVLVAPEEVARPAVSVRSCAGTPDPTTTERAAPRDQAQDCPSVIAGAPAPPPARPRLSGCQPAVREPAHPPSRQLVRIR
ncbi:hypothetical protein [Streptomyces sp. NPDC008122]|uniref:hypothetical protein n=1 Tax=Streptomyces sp. NPDC008122 TaxID=3364810 RepID=UPI0036E92127